jgi:hypothetical protein
VARATSNPLFFYTVEESDTGFILPSGSPRVFLTCLAGQIICPKAYFY